jgi:hypothetical protein
VVKQRYTDTGFKHTYGPEYFRVAGKPCHTHPGKRSSWPHHVKTVKTGGRDHGNVYPCCVDCHHAIESKGRQTYETAWDVDIAAVAREIGNEQGAFVP